MITSILDLVKFSMIHKRALMPTGYDTRFRDSGQRAPGSFAAPNTNNAACPHRPRPSEHLHHADRRPSPIFALPCRRQGSETRPSIVSVDVNVLHNCERENTWPVFCSTPVESLTRFNHGPMGPVGLSSGDTSGHETRRPSRLMSSASDKESSNNPGLLTTSSPLTTIGFLPILCR